MAGGGSMALAGGEVGAAAVVETSGSFGADGIVSVSAGSAASSGVEKSGSSWMTMTPMLSAKSLTETSSLGTRLHSEVAPASSVPDGGTESTTSASLPVQLGAAILKDGMERKR